MFYVGRCMRVRPDKACCFGIILLCCSIAALAPLSYWKGITTRGPRRERLVRIEGSAQGTLWRVENTRTLADAHDRRSRQNRHDNEVSGGTARSSALFRNGIVHDDPDAVSSLVGSPTSATSWQQRNTGVIDDGRNPRYVQQHEFVRTSDSGTSASANRKSDPGTQIPVTHVARFPGHVLTVQQSRTDSCSDMRESSGRFSSKALWSNIRHWSHPTQVSNQCGNKLLSPSSCTPLAELPERFRSCRHQFLLVLRWHRIQHKDTFAKSKHDLVPFECCQESKITWLMTGNRSRLADADIVEFYIADTDGHFPKRGKRNQIFLLYFLESLVWRGAGFQQRVIKSVNIVRSYMFSGALYAPYPPEPGCWEHRAKHMLAASRYKFVPFSKRVRNAVASLVSHCDTYNNRSGLMASLGRHVALHNFGRCFHNHNLPVAEQSWNSVPFSLARYTMALSVENTFCVDYVSEKSLRYVMLGVIPIVATWRGRPDYAKRMPNNHSYVDLSDFDSVQDVGRYL
eukprot:scpid73710/ scgid9398/ Alpha-(1,3)-fucosyltransferase 11; Fucosyltransferase XI; Galactoside 3-L-fucosyltransferase 11